MGFEDFFADKLVPPSGGSLEIGNIEISLIGEIKGK